MIGDYSAMSNAQILALRDATYEPGGVEFRSVEERKGKRRSITEHTAATWMSLISGRWSGLVEPRGKRIVATPRGIEVLEALARAGRRAAMSPLLVDILAPARAVVAPQPAPEQQEIGDAVRSL